MQRKGKVDDAKFYINMRDLACIKGEGIEPHILPSILSYPTRHRSWCRKGSETIHPHFPSYFPSFAFYLPPPHNTHIAGWGSTIPSVGVTFRSPTTSSSASLRSREGNISTHRPTSRHTLRGTSVVREERGMTGRYSLKGKL